MPGIGGDQMPLPSGGLNSSQGAFDSVLGALPLVGNLASGVAQIFQNASNRKFQLSMYNRERADALSDWNMQNAYNSPSAQMQRLKMAGLNPNLVYGSGTSQNVEASPVRQSTPSGTSQQAPQFNLSGAVPALMLGINKEIAEMKLQNTMTQNIVLQSQANRNNAAASVDQYKVDNIMPAQLGQINSTIDNLDSRTGLNNFDLGMKQILQETEIAIKSEQQSMLNVQINNAINANDRAAMMNATTIQQKLLNMAYTRMQMENNDLRRGVLQQQIYDIRDSAVLKQLDIQMKSLGATWTDPIAARIGAKLFGPKGAAAGGILPGAGGLMEGLGGY